MNGKEFKKALDNIVKEKDIDPEIIYSAMELALTSAYKKNFNSKTNVKVLFDRDTGEIKVYSYLTVVPDDKMTKEEYDDALFERYAEDDELDTKTEEEDGTINIKVDNLGADLTYTYNKNHKGYLVIPFSKMSAEYNPDYLKIYEDYKAVLTDYNDNITIKEAGSNA